MNTKENQERLLKEVDTITNGNFRVTQEVPLTVSTTFGPHTKAGGLLLRLKMTARDNKDGSWAYAFAATLPEPKKPRKFYHTSKAGE